MIRSFFLFFLIAFHISLWGYEANYRVTFLGLEDKEALQAMKNRSDLIHLQERAPPTINALRFRVESDVPGLIEVLHAYAYYDASITWEIEDINDEQVIVYIFIHPGPRYTLSKFEVLSSDCNNTLSLQTCKNITLDKLDISIGDPAFASNILASEGKLIALLADCGYPLAKIEDKKIIADALEKTMQVKFCVQTGPLCKFGPITLIGLKEVERRFILRKILWNEGDVFRSDWVETTQKRLIETDLFASVLITHADSVDQEGQLPMKMRFSETKHKTISVGGSYATTDGFGGSLTWTNRNFRGMGELLSADIWVAEPNSQGILTYTIPDFIRMNQDYTWQAEAIRENITVYRSQTYSMTNRIERVPNKKNYLSIGIRGEYTSVNESIRNGKYAILGLPFFWKHTHVENILDPISGYNISYKSTAYQQLNSDHERYYKQTLWVSSYFPLTENERIVLAVRAQLGSIFGASLSKIPFTKLFLGGSEEDLRGYRFKTVSPLNSNGDPVGGRGAFYWTAEFRFRLTKSLGFVTFSDWGNVTRRAYPTIEGKWFKSVGVGLRYFTFFGPLRLDAGFPLNKRPNDPNYRIYVSIGQSF